MGRTRNKPKGKKINPTFFVFCEGKTEEAYVNFLKSFYRLPSIIIHPKIGGNSITRKFIDRYKKGKPSHEKDVDYLLYDADVPVVVERLKEIANCRLLLSNPCIELWFLLHYKNQTANVDCEYCCKELKNRNKKTYKKGEIDEKLKEKLAERLRIACDRARKLTAYNCPSSTVYRLIDDLEEVK